MPAAHPPTLTCAPDARQPHRSLCSKRTKQHASPPEIQAVQLACRNLLKDDFESGARARRGGRAGWRLALLAWLLVVGRLSLA